MNTELEKLRIDDPAVIFPLSGQIRFSTRSDIEYAYYESRGFRREGKVYHDSIYLGRVISKTQSLFFNNTLNFFNFTLDTGFVSRPDLTKVSAPESLRLRFGDVWVYDDILKKSNLNDVISNISPSDSDTLHSLIIFRLSNPEAAYNNASCWFDRSYARILYPNASLSSSSISLMLDKLGDDHFYREFTSLYINYLYKINDNSFDFPILIDTTGLENDINTHLTKFSNHSGEINKEIRLIYVVDRNSGLPIFYKAISGNIVDVSILKTTLHSLSAFNINVSFIIMDAGFNSENNLLELNNLGIPFLTRLKANQTIYKNIIDEHSSSLFNKLDYLIKYNDRFLFCKKIKINVKNSQFFAYLCIDINKYSLDLNTLFNKSSIIDYINKDNKDDNDIKIINNISNEIDNVARFILISNQDIDHREVISHYYSRQQIEQVFESISNSD